MAMSLRDTLRKWKAQHEEDLYDVIRFDDVASAYQKGCIDALDEVLVYLEQKYSYPDEEIKDC